MNNQQKYFWGTLILICCFIPGRSQGVPTNGLGAYYKFSGNVGDSSGNSNHGIIYGATLTSDRFNAPNSAYYFNGTDSYIRVPSSASIEPQNALTLSAWIAIEYKASGWQPAIIKRYTVSTDPYDSYSFNINPTSPSNLHWLGQVSRSAAGTYKYAMAKNIVTSGIWVFLTSVYDGSTLKLYVNGKLDSSVSCTGLIGYSSLPLYFGCSSPGGDYFKGKIDDISIHNRALSESEISQMYSISSSVETSSSPNNRFEIYPNPFSNQINILNNTNKPIQALVFDLMGNKIFEQEVEPDNSVLDLIGIIGSGVYILQLDNLFYKVSKQ